MDDILTPALRRWLQNQVLTVDGHSMRDLEMVIRTQVALADRGDQAAIVRVGVLRRAARDLADMESNLRFLHGMLRDAAENLAS
jgi:hypothetical protein